ncbi:BnaC04g36910D [Brassica napus]|uniref:(rape) hypothetical protein n=1 Tax=Brassica napus TaxID=3708 RepID=A0A078G130_BRANA|nr:unnamed protein product [Brassica napus]CDY20265.1 BnaC04g36910D [Brassica napus]
MASPFCVDDHGLSFQARTRSLLMPFRYRCLCRYQTEIRGIGMRRTVKDRRRLIEIPIGLFLIAPPLVLLSPASMALHVTRGMERWLSFFPKRCWPSFF